MRTADASWQSLDYLKLVERAAFHRQIGFKIFLKLHSNSVILCEILERWEAGIDLPISIYYTLKEPIITGN